MKKSDNLLKNHLEYALSQEDEIVSNHTYFKEQEYFDIVRNGDIERIQKEGIVGMNLEYPQLLKYNTKKNEEYMAVAAVTLFARTAIEAGISSAESFMLSDSYLIRIAEAKNIDELLQLRNEAFIAFTKLVHERKKGGSAGRYIEECKRYISANIFKKIRVPDIANALSINEIYLERIFKSSEGITILQYIQREKIGRAKNLLMYSDRSIMEISDYLGFSTQSHFGHVFKKEVGETPMRFRTKNKITGF